MPLRMRAVLVVNQVLARTLKLLGLRERAFAIRQRQIRRKRTRAEARGSDRLSRPAAFEMDRKLDAIIDKDGGVFVEAGANNGFLQSNTYWLERFRGWRGVLVEPMPELAAEARLNRPNATVVECALVPAGHDGDTIQMRFGDLMTRVAELDRDGSWTATGVSPGWRDSYDTDVPARTLSSVLDETGFTDIDLLSLDVEGFEASVLRGLDLDRHAPRFLLVEMHDFEAMRGEIEDILGPRYELAERLSPIDALYRLSAPSAGA